MPRADAWIDALVALGIATVDRDTEPRWVESPGTHLTRADVLTPTVDTAVPLVVCRSRIEDVPDAGVTIGVGDPAVRIAFIPDCGCDACDSGSQDVLDELDSYIRPVVTGEFRHLRRGRQSITVLEDGRRQSHNIRMVELPPDIRFSAAPPSSPSIRAGVVPRRGRRTRDLVDEILADPSGWDEVSGSSWLAGPHGDMRH